MAGHCEDNMFTCIVCGRSGMSENEMKSHITEHEEDTVCPYCDQIWESVAGRDRHVNDEHRDFLTQSPSEHDGHTGRNDSEDGDKPMVNGHLETHLNTDSVFPCAASQPVCETSIPYNNLSNDFKETDDRKHGAYESLSSSLNAHGVDESGSSSQSIHGADESLSSSSSQHGAYKSVSSSASSDLQTACDIDKENIAMSSEDGRSKLFLDVPHTSGFGSKADVSPGVSFSCPFCSFCTNSEAFIERHVNHEHSDILSPGTSGTDSSRSTEDYGMLYSCPFCAASLDTPRCLEAHISAMHADVLTPVKWGPALPGTSQMADGGGDLLVCPVCEKRCSDPHSLSRHVDGHFSAEQTPDRVMSDKQLAEEIHRREVEAANRDNKDFHSLQVKYGMDERTGYKQQYEQSLERAVRKGDISVVEYHSQKATMQSNDLSGVDDGHSCTKDLIQRLNHYHKYTPGFVMRAWLCSAVDHYSGSYGDKGWGCGYRNLQMLLSSLVQDPMYRRILFNDNPQIPSIPKIQSLIEVAWTEGFDRQGCEQLGGRVVNTRKWIGATEIVALLSAFKIKCKLLDFHSPSGKDGTHPKLFEWVKNYFENQDTFRLPLYLQHQGHSRTVIGVEEMKDKSLRLLLFDPSSSKRHMEQFYGKVTGYLMKSLRRTINGLRAKQYQIVAVTGVLTDQQYEEYKVLKSEKVS